MFLVIYMHRGIRGLALRVNEAFTVLMKQLFLQQMSEQPLGLSAQAALRPPRHPGGEGSCEHCRKSVLGSDFPAQFNSCLIL